MIGKGGKNMNAAIQYNGLVLLYGYLQRLYVHERTKGLLDNGAFNVEKIDIITQHLKKIHDITDVFDNNKKLDETNQALLLDIANVCSEMSDEYKNEILNSKTFKDELAVVASTIYAEEHINNGIIKMGELFNPEIQDRFMQQILYYRNRVALVNAVVQKETEGKEISEKEKEQIKNWYVETSQTSSYMKKDFDSIKEYIQS